MAKLVVELVQHTPIIHFKHDEKGATIRGSELKPKLDTYLHKVGFKDGEDKTRFMNDLGHESFNYKVRVFEPKNWRTEKIEKHSVNREGKAKTEQFPLYFGNMGDGEDKQFVWCDSVKVEFFSLDEEMIKKISKVANDFFLLHNFGTRQDKGFGSFVTRNTSEEKFIKSFDHLFDVKTMDVNQVFKKIEVFYKFLRSGINDKYTDKNNPFYTKPAIFYYAKSKGIQWDKKTIKEHFFDNKLQTEIGMYKGEHVYSGRKQMIKELLGLSSREDWKSQNDVISRDHQPDHSENKIDRFKSPIDFKPFKSGDKFIVGIKLNPIPAEMLNQDFSVKNKNGQFTIRTVDSFDIKDFFKFISQKIATDSKFVEHIQKYPILVHSLFSFHQYNKKKGVVK